MQHVPDTVQEKMMRQPSEPLRALAPADPAHLTPAAPSTAARAVLASLLATSGRSPSLDLAPANPIWAYALEGDKEHLAVIGRGGVAFRLCAGVALAAGEPVAARADRVALAAAFAAYCRERGHIPAFYQVLDADLDGFRAAGFRALKIGEEALINLPAFSLVGKKIANVRHCVTHVEREGVRAELYLDGVGDEATLDGLEAVSTGWLGARSGRGEMGFSMGSFSREAMRRASLALARDAQGAICAFVTWRRTADGGMVLDLMRRVEAAPSGVIDFLIARALEGFRDAGLRYASLSLAPLAGVRGDGRARLAERLSGLLYEKGNGVYRYKSLYNFKKKFAPQWQSRYLLYPGGPVTLARVLLAVALVHTPRGAFSLPRPRRLAPMLLGFLRQCLDWRHGLQPGELALNLHLMAAITFLCALPEVHAAVGLFALSHVPHAYAAFALTLALLDGLGAPALARRLQVGRVILALGAVGFFAKALWGLGAGYDGGWMSWTVTLALAPVEVWVIWFLLQPEVRAYLLVRPAGASLGRHMLRAGVS